MDFFRTARQRLAFGLRKFLGALTSPAELIAKMPFSAGQESIIRIRCSPFQ
jgi:hypothetical protein